MYRSTPHTITLRTPAELMFNRNIRDKLPGIEQPIEIDRELADRDKQKKHEGKEYGDDKRNAKQSDIQVGDVVLTKRQSKPHKLATPYEDTAYEVTKRNGSETVIKSLESSATFRRNVAHLKKLPQSSIPGSTNSHEPQATTAAPIPDTQHLPTKRIRKAPVRFSPN